MDGDQEKTKDINIPAPRGRKNYVPSKESRELVQAMRIIGMPVETAAQLIKNTSGKFGISMETFYKYYRHEWEIGRAHV